MKRISKKSIAKLTSMLILSVMLIAVPVGMSRNSTVTADAAANKNAYAASDSAKSFGCSSGLDSKSILGNANTTADKQKNACANTANANNSCQSDKNTCTQAAQNSAGKTTAKNNTCSGNTCTTAAGNSCKNNTSCTGNTCKNNAQSLNDLLNSLKTQLEKQNNTTAAKPSGGCGQTTQTTSPKGNTTTTSPKGNTTTTSPNKGNTTTTSPKGNTTTTKPNTTTTAPANTGTSASAYEKQVVTLVNQERAKNGLSALTLNDKLGKMARAKSQDMHDNNYFSHTSPTYGSPFDMMKTFGISYRTAGENIAMGYATPESVVTGWMNSPGHRANILNKNFTQIGVGYVKDGHYWTQEFIG